MDVTIAESFGLSMLGMGIVFIVLVFLMYIIYLMSAIIKTADRRHEKKAGESGARGEQK